MFVESRYCFPLGLVANYPRDFPVTLWYHNLGAYIDGVHIGPTWGWDVEICAVLWSHILALRQALPVCSSPTLSLVQSIACHASTHRTCIMSLVRLIYG